ncbi:hypothetical protein F5Y14DRAFT_90308 [Nemania sp. NC0429]|nr:hypothetical protein F5Y14DRAFT_90308 [Nemania sp. NC0429]
MTRPQMIRADSIDLQDHDAPSAKDHKHSASKPTSANANANGNGNGNGNGSLAPHQAETIREVQEERAEEEARSPRVSWVDGDGDNHRDLQLYAEELASGIVNSLNGNKMQHQDALAIAQNGGVVGHAGDDDGDVDVATDDDDLDDDMMDKISSSPSIEDGGCFLLPTWPKRSDSLRNSLLNHDLSIPPVVVEPRSSSPYLDLPEHLPLRLSYQQSSKASVDAPNPSPHLLPGGYSGANENDNDDAGHETPPKHEPMVRDPGFVETITESSGRFHEHSYLPQDRDSGIDLKIEDFSLNRLTSTEDELAEDELISPYEFLIPYIASDDDDDEEEEDDFSYTDDCRFIDSGWGGECLQDAEDIDFEFVYALHTFVATVEGQANATKGDTMVLLDDSNSYWWLVRVVKDSSIGYLPAEHIETPTERLARLNKHRNIDLSATMLGDQAEKTRNPIMTAMKRRKAKTVTFTAPTYVDYSDIEYSDEEGGEDDAQAAQQAAQQEDQQKQTNSQQTTTDILGDDESAKVEPLKPRSQKQVKVDNAGAEEADEVESSTKEPMQRSSDEIFDGRTERTTRNGTVRNTDSFFRDETIETKKITLTPGLLRDDNDPRISSDSKDLRQRPSLEKDLAPDKNKDDKKKKDKERKDKDKKPSAIRSFFSRKDKKKSLDDDEESFGKRSMDAGAGFGDAEMVDEPEEMESSPQKSPPRGPGKLQKQQPRTEPSPTRKPATTSTAIAGSDHGHPLAAEAKTNAAASIPPVTVRMVESEQLENQGIQTTKDEKSRPGVSNPLPANGEPNLPQVTEATSRLDLDDFDSSEDEEVLPEPTRPPPAEPRREASEERSVRPVLPGSFPDSSINVPQQHEGAGTRSTVERLSESPVQVSPITPSNPPALMGDSSSQDDRPSSVSSPSPELADADSGTHRKQDSVATTTSPTTTSTSTWNDANLRAFFDSGSEIRDLLVMVYDDKLDTAPVGSSHPITSSLFREQNAKLAEMTSVSFVPQLSTLFLPWLKVLQRLDNMLGDWLARKERLRGTV